MRHLINYFRQCFCKHDFLIEELNVESSNWAGDKRTGPRVYMRCNKCGWHTIHWKF